MADSFPVAGTPEFEEWTRRTVENVLLGQSPNPNRSIVNQEQAEEEIHG